MSQNTVNSLLRCHCGQPAPIKMAWTEENPGRRFAGCRNYKIKSCSFFRWIDLEKTPRERMYDFYLKNQQLKHELGKFKDDMKLMEQRNEGLMKMKMMLEKNMYYEEKLKMEWKDKYDKKCMENARIGRAKFILGVIIVLVVMSFFKNMS